MRVAPQSMCERPMKVRCGQFDYACGILFKALARGRACLESPLEASGMTVATQPKWERPMKRARLPTPSCRSPSFFVAASGSRRGSGCVFLLSVACTRQIHRLKAKSGQTGPGWPSYVKNMCTWQLPLPSAAWQSGRCM